jgi:hypothetical protein
MRRHLLIAGWMCLSIAACKTSGNTSDILESEKAEKKDRAESADGFVVVDSARFHQLESGNDAEFLGCVCAKDHSDWRPWRYLKVGSHGYRAALSAGAAGDIETCVQQRKAATSECGGN